MKNEKQIFKSCVAKKDKPRFLFSPFVQDDYTYASNGHVLVRVSNRVIEGKYKSFNHPAIPGMFKTTSEEREITAEQLKKLLADCRVDEVREEEFTCKERDGEGDAIITLEGKNLRAKHVYTLLKIMKLTGVDRVAMRYNKIQLEPAWFYLNENVDMLIINVLL